MDAAFFIFTLLLLAGAVAAMSLRNLIHCTLSLVGVFFSAAGLFLLLGAEFLSFAQVMVYVGAIAILIVFATLLTGSRGAETGALAFRPWLLGAGTASLVSGVILAAVLTSRPLPEEGKTAATPTVRQLGEDLMSRFVLPLEVVGLLLTAALIGAVVLAVREGRTGRGKESPR